MTHPVVAALRGGSAAERRSACQAAPADPSAVLLVDALVDTLADADPAVARAATGALQQIGREHGAVLTALRGALGSGDPGLRLEAAWTWARLEPPTIALLPAVTSALAHARGDARWRAARLLVELGRLHDEVLPVVQGLAESDPAARVRRIALMALCELAPGAPDTLRAQLAASRDPDPGLQRLGLTGLAGLREAPPAVWARLAEVLADHPDPACRRVAAAAVGALGQPPAEIRTALARAVESDADPSVRAAADRAQRSLRPRPGQSPTGLS